jgi:hypothetical protein
MSPFAARVIGTMPLVVLSDGVANVVRLHAAIVR